MSPIRRAWITVRIDASVVWRELMDIIDSRTVRLFQALMYFGWALFGLYAVFFAEPVEIVDKAMGGVPYTTWVWVNILGPLMVVIGCFLARGTRVKGQLTRRAANGLVFQMFGDIAVTLMLAAYVAATLYSAWWGKGTHALFTYICLTGCALLLTIGDVRRLIVRSEWSR